MPTSKDYSEDQSQPRHDRTTLRAVAALANELQMFRAAAAADRAKHLAGLGLGADEIAYVNHVLEGLTHVSVNGPISVSWHRSEAMIMGSVR